MSLYLIYGWENILFLKNNFLRKCYTQFFFSWNNNNDREVAAQILIFCSDKPRFTILFFLQNKNGSEIVFVLNWFLIFGHTNANKQNTWRNYNDVISLKYRTKIIIICIIYTSNIIMIRLGDKGIFTFLVWLTEPVFWTDSEMSVFFKV